MKRKLYWGFRVWTEPERWARPQRLTVAILLSAGIVAIWALGVSGYLGRLLWVTGLNPTRYYLEHAFEKR